MARRYRWFATSPGSVTGPDTTRVHTSATAPLKQQQVAKVYQASGAPPASAQSITKREPPPCTSPVEVAAQESQHQFVTL